MMSYLAPKLDTSPFTLSRGNLVDMPLPRCDAELAVLSEIYFGIPLRLKNLYGGNGYARYEVEQDYNAYHGVGFKYNKSCIVGYDHSAFFWRSVIGNLTCGGIARASYGQCVVIGRRNTARIEYWIKDRREKQGSALRATFVRLARRYGAGENIVGRADLRSDDVLMSGRVDGALAASSGVAS